MWHTAGGDLVSFTKGNDGVLFMVNLHKQHVLHENGGPESCNLGPLPSPGRGQTISISLNAMQAALRLLVCPSTPLLQCSVLRTHDELP